MASNLTFAMYSAIGYDVCMITAKQAADEIGCSLSTVTRWARDLGFSNKFGGSIALTKTQVNAIKRNWKKQRGNPNFGKPTNTLLTRKNQ